MTWGKSGLLRVRQGGRSGRDWPAGHAALEGAVHACLQDTTHVPEESRNGPGCHCQGRRARADGLWSTCIMNVVHKRHSSTYPQPMQ